MNAVDVMTPDVISATPDTPLADLVRLMLDNGISAIPIVEHGRLVGIVSEGDLVRRTETGTEVPPSRWLALLLSGSWLAADYARTHGRKAGEIMTREVVTVTEATPIAEIALLFETRRIKRVPVMRDGKLIGIVSRRNLMQALASRLAAEPAAGTVADRTIREALVAELHGAARAFWPTGVNIVVTDGVVHLWGLALTEEKRRAIIVAAESIPGVRRVEDHMDDLRAVDLWNRPNWPSPAPP